jgi:hypothetical protein
MDAKGHSQHASIRGPRRAVNVEELADTDFLDDSCPEVDRPECPVP